MASVLIVEDDQHIRERLTCAVVKHPELNVCAESGFHDEGMKLLVTHKPNVLLVDLGLPDGDGIELINQATQFGNIESIVVTVFGDETHVMRAIEAGATGYLLKNTGVDDIGESIMEVLKGGAPISPAISRYLLQHFRNDKKITAVQQGTLPNLTERELNVLIYISKGLNYQEIAGTLNLSYHTVSTHIKRVYRKLHVSSRSEAVYEAEQLGLIHIRE